MGSTLQRAGAFTILGIGLLAGTVHAAGGGSFSAPSMPAPVDVAAEWRGGIDALNAQEWGKAVRRFRAVVDNQPRNADALNYLGYSYRKNGDPKKAQKFYEKALDVNPNHIGANEYLGELFLELQQVDKADERLAVLNSCCAQAPETAELASAIAAVKSGQAFKPKFPRLSY